MSDVSYSMQQRIAPKRGWNLSGPSIVRHLDDLLNASSRYRTRPLKGVYARVAGPRRRIRPHRGVGTLFAALIDDDLDLTDWYGRRLGRAP